MADKGDGWEASLRLGAADVTGLMRDLKWGSQAERNTIRSWLSVTLDGPAESVFSTDLRGDLGLDLTPSGGATERQFTGLLLDGRISTGEGYAIRAEDMSVRLDEGRIGGGFGREFSHQELIYLIMSAVEGVDADGASIEGLKLNRGRRMFVFIAPVPGLRLSGNGVVRLADVELYAPEGGMRYDDELIVQAAPDPTPPELSPGTPRVYIPVQATGFTEAINAGQLKLRRLLDWMSFRCGLSTPCYRAEGEWRYIEWQRGDGRTYVAETDWVYVRDTLPVMSRERYWLKWTPPRTRDSVLELSEDRGHRIYQTMDLLAPVLGKAEEDLTAAERALLSALHFHRRARQAPDKFDQLVSYWSALEFLLSHLKVPALFGKSEIRMMKEGARTALQGDVDATEAEGARVARLEDVLSRVNEATLRAKWEHFCQGVGLTLLDSDQAFMWREMRPARNDVQHGKLLHSMKQSELEHLGCIVEKAILLAAHALEGAG